MKHSCRTLILAAIVIVIGVTPLWADDLQGVLNESRIRGGLCVVVGPLDDALKLPVLAQERFVVQILATPSGQSPSSKNQPEANETKSNAQLPTAAIRAARESFYQRGWSGRVTVENWSERELPYAPNLASLVVLLESASNDLRAVDVRPTLTQWGSRLQTALRVVRPDGEIIHQQDGRWQRTIKPRPKDIDEWSQWRHGADRNAVSQDRRVDVPKHVQWLFSSSIVLEAADLVTARGRMFIQDRDMLLARDAFNGLPLWKAELYPHRKLGLEKPPALMVARNDLVFALMKDGKFRGLDAATGEPRLEFEDAGMPHTVLLLDDGLLVMVTEDSIKAFESQTAKLVWQQAANEPHTVTAGGGAIYYLEGNDKKGAGSGDVLARDAKTGELKWRRSYEWARRSDLASFGSGKIVFEVRRPAQWRELWSDKDREKAEKFQLAVIDAKTGQEDKKLFGVASSARHGEFCTAFWHQGQLLTEARTSKGLGIARYNPLDLSKPVDVFQANFAGDRGWGHCYPPVLTERFYINGQLHFTDLDAKAQKSNVITRGACHVLRAGYVPANGLIYTFPKHCQCFPMLNGTTCLAPEATSDDAQSEIKASTPEQQHPLETGPAFGAVKTSDNAESANDWPTFRHDEFRSGGTVAAVPDKLSTLWSATVVKLDASAKFKDKPPVDATLQSEWSDNPWTAGPVSAPVVANGLVLVAQCDHQRLVAMDAVTGRPRWHVDFSGRLDGPPTITQGMALIGCRDGWIYALRATDGVIAWRRRVAPSSRRISTYGQIESAWPCSSSVLVSRGLAYVSAGLHPNSDGGIRVLCLKPTTGELIWSNKFDDLGFDSAWPDEHDPRPKDKPGIQSDPWRTIRPQEYRHVDLPVRDGDAIAISRCAFDAQTGKVDLRKASGYYEVRPSGAKLPRTAWRYTDVQSKSPLAVNRGETVISTSPRKSMLFRADFAKGSIEKFNTDWVNVPFEQFKVGLSHASSKIYESGFRWAIATKDEGDAYPRSMLIAGDRLIYAHASGDITLHDLKDGREISRLKHTKLAWDSLAATSGKIYATTVEGQVVCWAAR